MWRCLKCGEEHEDSFVACRNCGSSKDGIEDPAFQDEIDVASIESSVSAGHTSIEFSAGPEMEDNKKAGNGVNHVMGGIFTIVIAACSWPFLAVWGWMSHNHNATPVEWGFYFICVYGPLVVGAIGIGFCVFGIFVDIRNPKRR